MRRCAYTMVVLCCILAGGCTLLVRDNGNVTVAFYNVQNLFDAVADGTEYAEFVPGSSWSSDDYERRLRATAEAILAIRPRPDILALAEVENARVVERLRTEFIPELGFAYAVTGGSPGSAVTVAVLSRYPITDARGHLPRTNVPVRCVLEAWIEVHGQELVLLVNHWKSKSGGAAATEPVRRTTARLVSERLAEIGPAIPTVVLGDFNSNPDEYARVGAAYPTALWPVEVSPLPRDALCVAPDAESAREGVPLADAAPGGTAPAAIPRGTLSAASLADAGRTGPCLVSPWFDSAHPGSYVFQERWDRIDGFLLNQALFDGVGLEFGTFGVTTDAKLLTADGFPRGWSASSHGFSDHLPVWITLERAPEVERLSALARR